MSNASCGTRSSENSSAKARASPPVKPCSRVANALGAETNWTDLAREMDVPLGRRAEAGKTSHHTLKNYVELMAGGYFLFVAYFWKRGQNTNDLSKSKKLFFNDPLLHTVALDRAPGLTKNVPALVENAIGLALYRSYEPSERLAETFVAPDRLHIWKTSSGAKSTSSRAPPTSSMSSRSSPETIPGWGLLQQQRKRIRDGPS
jgi:hypothetical protein